MRTAFWAASLLFIATPACPAPTNELTLPLGGLLRASTQGNATRFEWRSPSGRRGVLRALRDDHVAPRAPVARLELVAQPHSSVILLTETYPSKPGGMSYCQAGEERFLRVLTANGKLEETFRLKIASCRENLELSDPGLEWDPGSATLRIHWLPVPAVPDKPTIRTIRFTPEGKPAES